jgi:glyoxylate/hydroxypyruvate reductase A
MLRILFVARPALWEAYRAPLARALTEAGVTAEIGDRADDPGAVDYIIADPNAGPLDYRPFTRAKAVLGLWAGVEKFLANPTLTQPLARMVDPAMTEGMVQYVAGHVLRLNLRMDRHIRGTGGVWDPEPPPLPRDTPVAVLGLGELGGAAARALAALGFPVLGWSRRPRSIPGVLCRAGDAGLAETLAAARILVLLLPLTPDTANLIDAARLALLPAGAMIINPGRGGLIDDAALLAALDTGHIAQATLDVFREEPLPPGHPYWRHPRVTVTPHIASETRPETAARVIAANIARVEAGLPLMHAVDRHAGY